MRGPIVQRPNPSVFVLLTLICACLAAAPIWAQPPQKATNEIRIHFLNIGAGSCQIVECPGTNVSPIIIDCGSVSPSTTDMTAAEIATYAQAVLALYTEDPIVILSHPDIDHYNRIDDLMGARNAKLIWFGGKRSNYKSPAKAWLDGQEAASVPITGGLTDLPSGFSNSGNPVPVLQCGDANTFVLTVNTGFQKNPRSLVPRIQHGAFSATFTGDATGKTQEKIMENFPSFETTVLTGSHHGASTVDSNHENWALFAMPEITVFSSGTRFKHPKCSAVSVYHWNLARAEPHGFSCGREDSPPDYTPQFDVRVAEYVTERDGRVVITSDGTSTSVQCSLAATCDLVP